MDDCGPRDHLDETLGLMKLNSLPGQVNFVKYIPGGVSLLKKLQLVQIGASSFYD